MKRREIIKGLSLLPFAGPVASTPANAFASPLNVNTDRLTSALDIADEEMRKKGQALYRSLGVEPFVNCKGTNTIMGGSVARPEVRLAMESVSTLNVQLDELAFGVGKRLAELTGAEWGVVTAGCAAGLKLVTAACLTGGDPEKLIRIPDLSGFTKTEVVIPRSSRNVYDHAVRNAGVKIITVESIEQLKRALTERTAMVYMTAESPEPFSVQSVSKLAKPLNIPVVVDAASHILTVPNVHLGEGADIVAYSGGKGLKSAGCSGLLLGKKDILMSAWQASAPHHGFGRDNKLGREEHIGMLAAVETWVKMDHTAEMNKWVSWLETIRKKVSTVKGVQMRLTRPEPELLHHVTPYLYITWDPAVLHMTGQEVAEELGSVAPRIALNASREEPGVTGLTLVGYMMVPGNDKLAAERIYEVLSRKREPKAEVKMSPAAADLVGIWDLDVSFPSSNVIQQLFIEKQEGNWFSGTYKTEFSTRALTGSIDGNEIRMQSNYSIPGDRITSIFKASLGSDSMAGDIDLNEFLTASFKAKKRKTTINKRPIVYPKGRPQAS